MLEFIMVSDGKAFQEIRFDDLFPWLKEERKKDIPVPRELTNHKVGNLNNLVRVTAQDHPGTAGANRTYLVDYCTGKFPVVFQKGLPSEVGITGATNEALLAILEDRLQGFQAGPFPCDENELALHHVRCAMRWLHERTCRLVERAAEGTNVK